MKTMKQMQNLKHKIARVVSVMLGMFGIVTMFTINNVNISEKKDTLTFLIQEEKQFVDENKSLLANFITPKINKYDGPISESLLKCEEKYKNKDIENIFIHYDIKIIKGSLTIKYNDKADIIQSIDEIRNEILPVFGKAFQTESINWTYDEETKKYTFKTYPGQEDLWFCYFKNETEFFKEFFKIEDNKLQWPVKCKIGENCSIGYPDIDEDGKAANCSEAGYKGHQGTDINISFDQMDEGVDVYSALDGEVLWAFDGKYDRCEYPNSENSDCKDPTKNEEPNLSDGYRVCTDLGKYAKEGDGDAFWCFDGGNVVVIRHKDSGEIFATRYDHLKKSSILVKKGDFVKKGQKIAEVGSAGKSTQPHLHFEVWGKTYYDPIDPWSGDCGNTDSLWEE